MGPILFGLFCFAIYNANLRVIGSGDSLPARYLPLILWKDGTLKLDAHARLVAHGNPMGNPWERPAGIYGNVSYFEPWAYWMIRTRQHELASLYPIVTPVLVSPLYYPAAVWLDAKGWEQPHVGRVAEVMEKLSAAFLATLASVLLYVVLRRENARWGLVLAVAFALGTNTWMISSQALWQHGTGELLIALALLLVLSPASSLRLALLGAVCVLMTANRPPDGLVAGAFVLYTVWKVRHRALWLVAGAAAPLAALLYYNLDFIGHIAGGYAAGSSPGLKFFELSWSGIAGLLVSPARGLLVFTPFLVFLPFGLFQRLRDPASRGLALSLSLAAVAQLLLYSQADWRAGFSWGPRWLTDLLPVLVWMVAPAPLVLRPWARCLFLVTIAASIGIQTIGAFWYTKSCDPAIHIGDQPGMQGAWKVENTPFIAELRHPRGHADLLREAVGFIDFVGETQDPLAAKVPPLLAPGARLEGWALADGRTPASLYVLIDGIIVGSTQCFYPRADVNEVMKTTAASGWRMSANTSGVPVGQRTLQLAVRIEPTSDIRIIRELPVIVVAPGSPLGGPTAPQNTVSTDELDAMAARATLLLKERQSAEGYWLTYHTTGFHYDDPQQEMNTFLTSTLVDMLSPIENPRGLEEALGRARTHLASQVESDGLVRYHGLPDAPTIGTLGCIITPDADDTALVWRIAGLGADDPRRPGMLEILSRYRDARGLYRTWLAPRKDYQNLDPGRDPNPTDLAIQMNVYLMLRALDPKAAEELGAAIQRHYQDNDVWVYYAKAPLLPYLRSAELQMLGLNIPLPSERLALSAPGQEIWSEAAQRTAEVMVSTPDRSQREAIHRLLARLGENDFRLLRSTPPLLYHNDQTATVKRFYWSEDFGYALWLRLYEATRAENEERKPQSL